MTLLLDVFIPGVPQPAGSKKGFAVKNKATGKTRVVIADDAKKSRPWKTHVTALVSEMHGGPYDGPVRMELTFTMPRPRGHYGKRGLLPSARPFPDVVPDASKLARAVEDAISDAAVWTDDCRVVEQTVRKVYGDRPGVHIRVCAMDSGSVTPG